MISETQAKRYCGEDLSAIENYERAVNDKSCIWDLHHRLEIQGQFKNSHELLKKCGMYYGVPASQLVFLTHAEHSRMHNKGRPKSEEARRRMSEAKKGRPNGWIGRRHSEEARRRMSDALSGEKNPNFGKHPSEETRRRMSEALKGRQFSEETRRRISEARKKYWMKRKAATSE